MKHNNDAFGYYSQSTSGKVPNPVSGMPDAVISAGPVFNCKCVVVSEAEPPLWLALEENARAFERGVRALRARSEQ